MFFSRRDNNNITLLNVDFNARDIPVSLVSFCGAESKSDIVLVRLALVLEIK